MKLQYSRDISGLGGKLEVFRTPQRRGAHGTFDGKRVARKCTNPSELRSNKVPDSEGEEGHNLIFDTQRKALAAAAAAEAKAALGQLLHLGKFLFSLSLSLSQANQHVMLARRSVFLRWSIEKGSESC